MISDTLNAVLKAEEEARLITAQADEEARAIVLDADARADALRKETIQSVRSERKKVVEEAEKEGAQELEKIILAGKAVADKLGEQAAVKKAAQFIKEKMTDSYVGR